MFVLERAAGHLLRACPMSGRRPPGSSGAALVTRRRDDAGVLVEPPELFGDLRQEFDPAAPDQQLDEVAGPIRDLLAEPVGDRPLADRERRRRGCQDRGPRRVAEGPSAAASRSDAPARRASRRGGDLERSVGVATGALDGRPSAGATSGVPVAGGPLVARNSSTSRRWRSSVIDLADDLAGGGQGKVGDLGPQVARWPARFSASISAAAWSRSRSSSSRVSAMSASRSPGRPSGRGRGCLGLATGLR